MKENRVKKWKRQISLLLALVLTIGTVFTGKTDVSAASKKVSLNITNLSLSVGKSKKLKVSGAKKVKWSTSKKSVASVTKNGKIKAKKAGMATITAKVSGKKLRCNVVVHRPSSKKKDILIVYFSQSGTTRAVAKKIQKLTGGDLLRIQEKNKYPTDYDKLTAQGKRELNQNARPGITTVVGNLKDYDTVFIGYPIWWHSTPKVIDTFLEKYKMKGKTVIPFCTSGGSDISESMPVIRKLCKGATLFEGYTADTGSKKEISNWLKKMGFLEF